MAEPNSAFYTNISHLKDPSTIRVNIKRVGEVLWSRYDSHSRKLIPIVDHNFDGVFSDLYRTKKLNVDVEIWSLILTCDGKTYSFGYFYNIADGRQTQLGKFHNSLTNLEKDDIVKLWIDKLGNKGLKMGVTINDIKIPFD